MCAEAIDEPDRVRVPGCISPSAVRSCRIRTARPGLVVLELVRRDALAAVIPALPILDVPDLRALPVARREDGELFTVRLHGTHLLIAGATGAGEGLLPVGPGPGHAARDGLGAGAGACV